MRDGCGALVKRATQRSGRVGGGEVVGDDRGADAVGGLEALGEVAQPVIAPDHEHEIGAARGEPRPACQAPLSRSVRNPASASSGTRSWPIVSRSRTVTAWSSSESKSTVTQKGVPISSWRR